MLHFFPNVKSCVICQVCHLKLEPWSPLINVLWRRPWVWQRARVSPVNPIENKRVLLKGEGGFFHLAVNTITRTIRPSRVRSQQVQDCTSLYPSLSLEKPLPRARSVIIPLARSWAWTAESSSPPLSSRQTSTRTKKSLSFLRTRKRVYREPSKLATNARAPRREPPDPMGRQTSRAVMGQFSRGCYLSAPILVLLGLRVVATLARGKSWAVWGGELRAAQRRVLRGVKVSPQHWPGGKCSQFCRECLDFQTCKVILNASKPSWNGIKLSKNHFVWNIDHFISISF